MGFMLFHHVAVLEVMPHCDYVRSHLSSTSPHSQNSPFRQGSTTLLPSLSEQLPGAWQTFSVALVSWQACKFRSERGDCFYHFSLPHPQRLSTCLGTKISAIHLRCTYPQPGVSDTDCPIPTALQLTNPSAGKWEQRRSSKTVHCSQVLETGQTGSHRSATTTSMIPFIIYCIVL